MDFISLGPSISTLKVDTFL